MADTSSPFDFLSALVGGGSLLSAYGGIQRGQSTAAAYNYNAQTDLNNAALSEQQGSFAASMAYNKGRRVNAQAVANYGASGVTMTGSPLDVLADSTKNVISDTLMSAVPFANRAAGLTSEANLDKSAAAGALTSSYFTVGSDLAKGAMRLRGSGSFPSFGFGDS